MKSYSSNPIISVLPTNKGEATLEATFMLRDMYAGWAEERDELEEYYPEQGLIILQKKELDKSGSLANETGIHLVTFIPASDEQNRRCTVPVWVNVVEGTKLRLGVFAERMEALRGIVLKTFQATSAKPRRCYVLTPYKKIKGFEDEPELFGRAVDEALRGKGLVMSPVKEISNGEA